MQAYSDYQHEVGIESIKCQFDNYYCVEFLIKGIKMIYQSKLWKKKSKAMFVLVREDSDILNQLNVGDIMNMKYYSNDASNPTQNLNTEIKYITKDDKGRFKGHYLIGLAIA